MSDQLHYFEPGTEPKHLALHSDSMLALAADGGAQIKVIDIQAKSVRWTLKGHMSPAVEARFSPDGRKALSRAEDRTVCLWNLENGELIGAFGPLNEDIATIDFRTDSEQFLILCEDGIGRIYSTANCTLVTDFTTSFIENIRHVRIFYSKNIKPIANFTKNKLLLLIADYAGYAKFSLILTNIHEESQDTISLSTGFPRDAKPKDKSYAQRHTDYIKCANRDCSRIALFSTELVPGTGRVGNIYLFNAQTGERIPTCDDRIVIRSICNFSPDGRLFVLEDPHPNPKLLIVFNAFNVRFQI
jgi:WD40 repeat protein